MSGSRSLTTVIGLDRAGGFRAVAAIRQALGASYARLPVKISYKNKAERVDIALDGDFATRELFGRHVCGRARANFAVADLAGDACQAEIGDAHASAAVEHDVCGLQVAMQQALLVRGGEARANLPRDFDSFVLREAANAADERREILAIYIFHGDEWRIAGHADVENAADVGMRYLPCDAHFAVESRERSRIVGEIGRKNFRATS